MLIQVGLLYPYVGSFAVYKCPADKKNSALAGNHRDPDRPQHVDERLDESDPELEYHTISFRQMHGFPEAGRSQPAGGGFSFCIH